MLVLRWYFPYRSSSTGDAMWKKVLADILTAARFVLAIVIVVVASS